MNLEHVESAMTEIVQAVSGLHLDDVLTVETALQAGWLTDGERSQLKPLADAFRHLGQTGAASEQEQ